MTDFPTLSAVDAATGTPRWQRPWDGVATLGPASADAFVLGSEVRSMDDGRELASITIGDFVALSGTTLITNEHATTFTARDLRNGTALWKTPAFAAGDYGHQLVVGDVLYVGHQAPRPSGADPHSHPVTPLDRIDRLDLRDGQKLDPIIPPAGTYQVIGGGSGVLLAQGRTLVRNDRPDDWVALIDASTGTSRAILAPSASAASPQPVVDPSHEICLLDAGWLCVDLSTGAQTRRDIDFALDQRTAVAVRRDNAGAQVSGVDLASGAVRWHSAPFSEIANSDQPQERAGAQVEPLFVAIACLDAGPLGMDTVNAARGEHCTSSALVAINV